MKKIIFIAALGLMSCDEADEASQLSATGDHFAARHCEIFVDQVSIFRSSHGTHGIYFYVKTLNDRLDGEIAEVGLRRRLTTTSYYNRTPQVGQWENETLEPYFGAQDYYRISVYLGSDYGTSSAEGAFYVRTDKGTNYWLKAGPLEDFAINDSGYFEIRDLHYRNGSSFYSKVHTQDQEVLRKWNPDRCY